MQRLWKLFPIARALKGYDRQRLTADLVAGLTVGVLLIPQSMAYADLASLPPILGLFSATIPLIVYALFSSCNQLAIGPVAIVSLLVTSGVGQLAPPGSPEYIGLVLQLTLLVGVIQFLAGALRLGFLANFLSRPVIHGFTAAAALIIISSQLGQLLGIKISRSPYLHETAVQLWRHHGNVDWMTASIGVFCIVLILALRRLKRTIPAALFAAIAGTAFVFGFEPARDVVSYIGPIGGGLPPLALPSVNVESLVALLPIATVISMIGFLSSFAVAKSMEYKHPNQQVNANKEFLALGIANTAGSFFSVFPVAGGFARTAVNERAGATSQLASIISALVVLLSLLLLMPLFTYLPRTALAAIIITAVFPLLSMHHALSLWHGDKQDFFSFISTFAVTLIFGVELGIEIAVVLSLIIVIYRASTPHTAVIGQLPTNGHYLNMERFDDAKEIPGILILRFDGPLFFGNIDSLVGQLKKHESEHTEDVEIFILDAGCISDIDFSAMCVLEDIFEEFNQRDVHFALASARGPVRDALKRSGLAAEIGEENFFMDVAQAVTQLKKRHGKDKD